MFLQNPWPLARTVPQCKSWQQEARFYLLKFSQKKNKYWDMQNIDTWNVFLEEPQCFYSPYFIWEHIFFLPTYLVLLVFIFYMLVFLYSWFIITRGFGYVLTFTASGKCSADLNVIFDHRPSLCGKPRKLQWGSREPAAYNREALPVTLSQPAGGKRLSTGSFSKDQSQRKRIISTFHI